MVAGDNRLGEDRKHFTIIVGQLNVELCHEHTSDTRYGARDCDDVAVSRQAVKLAEDGQLFFGNRTVMLRQAENIFGEYGAVDLVITKKISDDHR
ncbi:hypothetical protein D3C71_1342430 [compost metagenome]